MELRYFNSEAVTAFILLLGKGGMTVVRAVRAVVVVVCVVGGNHRGSHLATRGGGSARHIGLID